MSARMLSTVVGLMLVASAAFAQTANDDLLTLDVIRSINTYTRFTIFDDINVKVDNGTVTLLGKVTMPFKRDELARRIERLGGVVAVNNARAIYGNSAFWQYAAMVNPPIHIIVEGGRVRLTGVVASEVDRALARSLATGRGELSVVNALKTDAEVTAERAVSNAQLQRIK